MSRAKPTEQTSDQPPRRLSSTDLLAGSNRVVIFHEGMEYLLQITRQGKLILTK